MTELRILLFGNPHPLPRQKRVDPDVDNYGKRSPNYGKVLPKVRTAVKSLANFTVADVANATGMDRGTVNRALVKLAKEGVVRKISRQTAGRDRAPAVWQRVATSPL